MKKFLCVLLTFITAFCFVSCKKENEPAEPKPTLAAKSGTTGAELTKKYAQKLGIKVDYYKDSLLMYQAVMNGTNQACYEDCYVADWAINKDNLALKTIGEPENKSEYGLAVKKGKNKEFLELFNAGLANIKASGEFDAILEKYGFTDVEKFEDKTAVRVESGVVPEEKYIIYSDNAFAPFVFLDQETKKYVGIDMDIFDAIAKDQGFEYEMHNEDFEEALDALKKEKADAVIAGMSISEERKKDFDFSDGYLEGGQILVVPIYSEITSVYDLGK